jgi:hypothetical protein
VQCATPSFCVAVGAYTDRRGHQQSLIEIIHDR